MLEELKKEVYEANLALVRHDLVILTWGNASAVDRQAGLMVIKPSGVDYDAMTPSDMVVVALDGTVVEGRLRPSSDTPTHLALYRAFPEIGGVVHTHSKWAVAWAQAGRNIPCYGTTHADCFYGQIPCIRGLKREEVESGYEWNTGMAIAEFFSDKNPLAVPGALCRNHGPFAWGANVSAAVHNAVVLEAVAEMAAYSTTLDSRIEPVPDFILDKHYYRKHGSNAYYGQG